MLLNSPAMQTEQCNAIQVCKLWISRKVLFIISLLSQSYYHMMVKQFINRRVCEVCDWYEVYLWHTYDAYYVSCGDKLEMMPGNP